MAVDPRKRQKRLEKRKAKQKKKKKALARQKPEDVTTRLQRAGSAPILHCLANKSLWDQGMANVLFSRELPDGRVAYVIFLVDVYCLGVKDVAYDVAVRTRYDSEVIGKIFRHDEAIKLTPACMRKLVEGAVEYAHSLGLPPHADYPRARVIFGDVDPGECDQEFTYGKDGKPFFIAGPRDSVSRCRRIMATLEEHCGPGGYHFLMPVGPSELTPEMLESLEYEEDEDED